MTDYNYVYLHTFTIYRVIKKLVTSKLLEKLYYKQSIKLITYQKEATQKEEELVIMRKRTIGLQLKLRQQHNILTAEKTEKQKMIYELANQQETIG